MQDQLCILGQHVVIKLGKLWSHYSNSSPVGSFYGVTNASSITLVINENPSVSKNFKTVNYEGDNGWQVDSFISDAQKFDAGSTPGSWISTSDTVAQVPSYIKGAYDGLGNAYPSPLTQPIYRYGFDRKENKYYANLNNNSVPTDGEVIYGSQMTGIKGRYATVTLSTDNVTNPGGIKELFSVGSVFSLSSY